MYATIQRVSLLAAALVAAIAPPVFGQLGPTNAWQRLGPDYRPGEATCQNVLPHPRRTGELVVGARPTGLLLTIDNGRTWQHTSEAFNPDGTIGPNPESLARAPSSADVVYAGIESRGVRRSDDGGKTWRDLSQTLPKGRARNGVSVAVHPHDPQTVWLGTDGGIFKTIDGGRHWRRLTRGLPSGAVKSGNDVSQTVVKMIVDARRPQRLWLGIYASGLNEPAGVWRSEDGGESWQAASKGIDSGSQNAGWMPMPRDWVMALARSPSEPETFFAATPLAVYRSTDGARTWTKLPHATGAMAVAVHPRDARHVFISGKEGRVEHSLDGGRTWRDLSAGLRLGREPNASKVELELIGPDGKKKKIECTPGRFQNQVVSFAFDPRDDDTIYACANAGLYRLKLGGGR